MSHKGTITVESTPEKGTRFEVLFPVHKTVTEPFEKKSERKVMPKGNENILFVDDEGSIVEQGLEVLKRLGYNAVGCTNSVEAMAAFIGEPDRFDLVITDFTMPQLTGVELAKNILGIRPDMPIIICSGYSNQVNQQKAEAVGIKEFALKPILPNTLATLIRDILDESKVDPIRSN
jgi:DNA-binding NtrC family response regulator